MLCPQNEIFISMIKVLKFILKIGRKLFKILVLMYLNFVS